MLEFADVDRTGASRAIVVVALVSGAALTLLFLSLSPQTRRLFDETAVPIVVAAVVALACVTAGWAGAAVTCRVMGARPEAIALDEALLVGAAVFGTLAGAVATISVAPLPAVTIALAVASAPLFWRRLVTYGLPARVPALALVVAPMVLLGGLAALTPVATLDELVYKLGVPHAYEIYGRMVELPLNSNSYLAMSLHLADVPALMLGGGVAARLLHFVVYVAALAAIHRLALRFTRSGAMWVVITVASTPALMITSGWAFSEWCTAGLLVVSFERYQRWLDSGGTADFVLTFAAAGAAASVKYTALPWLGVFGLLLLWRHRRAATVLSATAIGSVFGAFFYIRNAVWSGSPVAPFLLPNAPEVENYRSGYAFSGWVDFFTGADIFDPRIADEALGVLLPLSIVAAIVGARWRDRATRDLMIIGLVQMAVLLTIAPGSRNMMHGLLAPGIVGAAVIAEAVIASGFAARAAAALLAAVILFSQSMLSIITLADNVPYLTGSETTAQFLARTHAFARPYSWIAASLPEDARILMVGETRTFYLEREPVSGGNLDGPRIAAWLAQFRSPEEMLTGLRQRGITHVLMHPIWLRMRSDDAEPPGMIGRELLLELDPPTHDTLRSFLARYAAQVYGDGEYLIFELRR